MPGKLIEVVADAEAKKATDVAPHGVFDVLPFGVRAKPLIEFVEQGAYQREAFVDKHGLAGQAVEIVGQAMTTDFADSFDGTCKGLIGYHMNVQAAQRVYDQSGLGPSDFQVIELHDCFSANELLLYEALGLCAEGEAPKLIDNGDVTYGGRWVVNPSGGLISKGHPLGATGLAQCAELTWQLRGAADKRQVDNVTAALQHNIGLGGAAVVTAYQRAER